ncbi:T9SS sorting signal type C domain-containing protein [Flavobacterium sp. W1B]|uniref:T9SS sorting signal type C domain-containing protein n=1 Tax=Flavobacterium sp. W1B TaxID=3394146 RepID=UPI0039BC6354
MEKQLHQQKKIFIVLLILNLLFTSVISAQCAISTTTYSSSLSCGSGSLSSCGGIVNIGNGTNPISLIMDSDLDLTTCGVVQLIVNNATLDFSTANKRLYLSEGSSIVFVNGGTLNPAGGNGGGCTGNDRVYIGGTLLATCQGGAGLLGFDDLVSLGGTGKATSNSPVCSGNSINLSATPPPNGSFIYSWSGPGLAATPYSTSSNYSFIATTTPITSSVYTVSMKRTSDSKIITANTTVLVSQSPVIITQPSNQLDCEGSSVRFKVVASGSGLTYTWQRKKPTDGSFITIPVSETNTTYPSTGEIRVDNVGSAQYPDGAQFQVVVSNGICTVTSSIATLSVNEIINVSSPPLTPSQSVLDVTLCYGANYSYAVTTSYPSNVVSYKWKRSVVSGTWTDVIDGGHFSGATTATLNIIGGTPGESAEYRVYITFKASGADCNTSSDSRTRAITFLPQLTTPITTIVQPNCTTATGSITVTVQSPTDFYSFDNGNSFQASNVKSGLVVGTYKIIIKNIAGCFSSVSTAVINPQPLIPSAPIIVTITQPNCTLDTGSVVLNGLPSSGIWTLICSGTLSATTTGTGTSTAITGLTDGGVYTFTVSNGTCTSVASASVNIDAISTMTSTWNGSAWINGIPDNSKRIVFSGDYSSTSDVAGCSCKVVAGANVVINSAHTLTVTNDIKVLGTLTFENNSSLVQINDAAINSGSIVYKRNTAPVKRYDFTYWSSPVAGQTLYNLSPNTLFDKYYSFDPDKGWVIHYNGNVTMNPGQGYIIRAPQYFSITVASVDANPKFIGVPNNGIKAVSVSADKSYLIGNPYPSAVDADQFLIYNSAALEGTLYFWTHNSPPSNAVVGNAIYNYTDNDYASYNLTGGTRTSISATKDSDPNDPNDNNNLNLPTGKIAAGQSFFATSSASGGMVTFNNSMRISGGSSGINNAQFFRFNTTSKSNDTNAIEKNRIWLNLSNQQGVFKQTLIGYVTGATNGYEGFFDGISYDGNQFVDFYSINENVNLAIQGRALPFRENDTISLGYKTVLNGNFQISIDQTDGKLVSQNVFLEDKLMHVVHDLKKSSYDFVSEKGTFNNRFVLRYSDKPSLILDPGIDEKVFVSVVNKELKISSFDGLIKEVAIYDIAGSRVFYKVDVNSENLVASNLVSGLQVLIVNVVLQNGLAFSKKIIY